MRKRYVVTSLMHPATCYYLTPGKVALFDNLQISGVDLHFSIDVYGAIKCNSLEEAEVWVLGLITTHPRFAPFSVQPVYYPITEATVIVGPGVSID